MSINENDQNDSYQSELVDLPRRKDNKSSSFQKYSFNYLEDQNAFDTPDMFHRAYHHEMLPTETPNQSINCYSTM